MSNLQSSHWLRRAAIRRGQVGAWGAGVELQVKQEGWTAKTG